MRRGDIKRLFTKGPSIASRVIGFGALALILILLSVYTDHLVPVRSAAGAAATPFYHITKWPGQIWGWAGDNLRTRDRLQEENDTMRAELLIHKGKLQKMASLAAENVRLRQLLNSAEMVTDRVLITELIGVSPDPLQHKVVIDKGSRHGVELGQPLLDASGLMGQVVEVREATAQVLLITDTTHALPVQVNRNGVRAVAEGTGNLHKLTLRHVSNTVDIRVGDMLVSSGLGGRFPVGYPVAEVVSVVNDPGKSFAEIVARPKAQLNRSRHVLLVFDGGHAQSETADE